MLNTIFYSALAATTTALIAYMTRGRRLPRLGHALIRGAQRAKAIVGAHRRALAVIAILAGLGVNAWEANQIMEITDSTRGALCSYKADLNSRMQANKRQIANPEVFGLTALAVQTLELTVHSQQQAIYSLRRLGC